MNRIHSKIWSKSLQSIVVASELAKANGKGRVGARLRTAALGAILSTVTSVAATDANYSRVAPEVSEDDSQLQANKQRRLATRKPVALIAASNAKYVVTANSNDGMAEMQDDGRTAVGIGVIADGRDATALGYNAHAGVDYATAVGANSAALALGGSALGDGAVAFGEFSAATGYGSNALGTLSTAMGSHSIASSNYGTAIGGKSQANGASSVAVGYGSVSNAVSGVAIGNSSLANGALSVAMGAGSQTQGSFATATGAFTTAIGWQATAYGYGAYVDAWEGTAVGAGASSNGANGSSLGAYARAGKDENSVGNGDYTTAIGVQSRATEDSASALGYRSYAQANRATVLGSNAATTKDATNSVALGAHSLADRANAVSVGTAQAWTDATGVVHEANSRQITNVAAGTIGTDAVNLDQLYAASGTAQHYLSATGYADGSDDAQATGENSIAMGASSSAIGQRSLAVGDNARSIAKNGTALGSQSIVLIGADNSVALGHASVADRANSVSMGAAQSWIDNQGNTHDAFDRQITNVAAGTQATDAVNKAQLDATVDGLIQGSALGNAVSYDSPDRSVATFAGSAGTKLANVAAGYVGSGSLEAINGGQLYNLGHATAQILGADAGFSNAGFTNPAFSIQGIQYNTVGHALVALDGAVSGALSSIEDISGKLASSLGNGSQYMTESSGNGLAFGENSVAKDKGDIAIGHGAQIGADNSITIGTDARSTANATDSVTVGANASNDAASGTAIGSGASVMADANNAIALGSNSVADRANSASMGSTGNERQITHVAAGTALTDAANKGQIDQTLVTAKAYADAGDQKTLGDAKAYTDSRLGNVVSSADYNAFKSDVNNRFTTINNRIDRVGAMGTAMAGMAGAIAAAPGTNNRVSAAIGGYGGQAALAVGYAQRIPGNGSVLIGGAVSGAGEASGSVGVSFGW
ncbi:ESPR-type extended signal peptide-containing protein [Dyella sp. 20L07]|uniref:ESPR-type extended signal peptide-containing protein n=1 Tax=Dyella sp. 20L07 TaxID=3384240 RepID=UPI003D2BD4DB